MQKDLSIIKWDTFQRTINFKDKSWNIIDLTWSTIKFAIKRKYSDLVPEINVNAVITNPTSWVAEIQTDINLSPWNYYYDISWKDSLWKTTTFLNWIFNIKNEVWVI